MTNAQPEDVRYSSAREAMGEADSILGTLSIAVGAIAANITCSRWYRHYEYYACFCYRKNKRNRYQKKLSVQEQGDVFDTVFN